MTRLHPKSGDDSILRWIGDLDHPFYEDERNRYVWYEAQAIGFQFLGLASYLIAGVSMLVGGATALPYAIAMTAPFVISGLVLKGYVSRRGADYWPQSFDFRRSRGIVVLVVTAVLMAGFARAFLGAEGGGSSIIGIFVGVALAGAGLAVGGQMQKKKDAAALLEDD